MSDAEVTPEKQIVVIGITAPLGTEVDYFHGCLKTLLESEYGAAVCSIKLSDLISHEYASEIQTAGFKALPWLKKLKRKIELGNLLRSDYRKNDLFGRYAHLRILDCYKSIVSSDSTKHFIIVDQFKRPEEIRFLEKLLGDAFWLCAVDSPIEKRIQKLTDGNDELLREAKDLIYVDENQEDVDNNKCGQQMRQVYQLSHSVFADEFDRSKVMQFIDLLHGSHLVLPSPDEYYMNLAYSASLRTGDLSRQVGAVVVTERFDQISCGANEVNRFGGGTYWPGADSQTDLSRRQDPNKKVIAEIKEDLKAKLQNKIGLGTEEADALLNNSRIDDLTEFHRTTHAEMDAILSAQRNGVQVRDATIYCTTFPCHNCAKHIVSAGIKRVVYFEPYPKSLALSLHDDSISAQLVPGKVHFQDFRGITHKRFTELFSMKHSSGADIRRKDKDGRVKEFHRKGELLRFKLWEAGFNFTADVVLEFFDKNGRLLHAKKAA